MVTASVLKPNAESKWLVPVRETIAETSSNHRSHPLMREVTLNNVTLDTNIMKKTYGKVTVGTARVKR